MLPELGQKAVVVLPFLNRTSARKRLYRLMSTPGMRAGYLWMVNEWISVTS
jgi:hypothetical protein